MHTDINVIFFFYLFHVRNEHKNIIKSGCMHSCYIYIRMRTNDKGKNKGFILLTPESRGQNLHSPRQVKMGGRDRKPSRNAAHVYICEHTVRWAKDTQARAGVLRATKRYVILGDYVNIIKPKTICVYAL